MRLVTLSRKRNWKKLNLFENKVINGLLNGLLTWK